MGDATYSSGSMLSPSNTFQAVAKLVCSDMTNKMAVTGPVAMPAMINMLLPLRKKPTHSRRTACSAFCGITLGFSGWNFVKATPRKESVMHCA